MKGVKTWKRKACAGLAVTAADQKTGTYSKGMRQEVRSN